MEIAAAVSFVLLLAGTLLLAARLYVWDGMFLLALGVAGMALILRRTFFPAGTKLSWSFNWRTIPQVRWVQGLTLLLSTSVGWVARSREGTSDFTILFLLWLLAVLGFIASLYLDPLADALRKPRPDLKLSRWEWLGLAALLLAAGLARGISLGQIPGNVGGDEGLQARMALDLLGPPLGNPFATGWYAVPTFSFLIYGLGMRIFGATVAGVRALSMLVGVATVAATFSLGRSLGGRRVGWVAAVTVAFSAYAIHFSRVASNQVFDPLIGALTFGLLWRAMEDDDLALWGLAGMSCAAGWYLYFGARWVTGMVGIFLLWRLFKEPRFLARRWQGLTLAAVGGLVVLMPLLLWYAAHPDDMAARYNQVSIFASGWLANEVIITGRSAPQLLLDQLFKAVGAFHVIPDRSFWYYPETPLADFVTGALMLVGFVAAALRWRWPGRGLTLMWLFSTMVMAWGITENAPSSQRGLLTLPAVGLMVGWGVDALFEIWHKRSRWVWQVVLALMGAMAILNLTFYFQVYSPHRIYGNPTAETGMEIIKFLQANPAPNEKHYFLGAPYMYWGFGAFAFLLPELNDTVDLEAGVLPMDVAGPARFIVVEDRVGDLDRLQEIYPGGKAQAIFGTQSRRVAWIYDWPGP